jgi:hypothetical protein
LFALCSSIAGMSNASITICLKLDMPALYNLYLSDLLRKYSSVCKYHFTCFSFVTNWEWMFAYKNFRERRHQFSSLNP